MAIVEENFPRGGKSRDEKRERPANEKKCRWIREKEFEKKKKKKTKRAPPSFSL